MFCLSHILNSTFAQHKTDKNTIGTENVTWQASGSEFSFITDKPHTKNDK